MSNKKDLLIEFGTEELPPKALKKLSDAFTGNIQAGLEKAKLDFTEINGYATPRRLAVVVTELQVSQEAREVTRRGPAITAAYGEDGCATKAAEGFAQSCGVAVEQLDKLETDKGAWLVFNSVEQGQETSELIPDIIRQALNKLPIPKRMKWADLKEEFVRPVHWLVLLFGKDVIDATILNVKSCRETRGHRFHHPGTIHLADPAAYVPLLQAEGHVIADFNQRRDTIRAMVMEVAAGIDGNAEIDNDLLDEVTGLVEWPVAVVGNFDDKFLDVPTEALVSAMKGHQKYFPVLDKKGKLMPCFITIANIESSAQENVRKGNERVIRPRLADAMFFWEQDKNHSLFDRVDQLNTVIFQQKLGTLYEKSERIAGLAIEIASDLNADEQMASRAAHLCKCDLMTNMVGEFPELQGIMGRYYARNDNEPDEIAIAIDEHHMPRFAGDKLPQTATGQSVAIADKLDSLVGIFGIGQVPTGDKDPFGLRRSALGVLRIFIENKLALDLSGLIASAIKQYGDKIKTKNLDQQVYDFMMERLRTYYIDRDISTDVFESVICRKPASPYDFDQRVQAVEAFRKLPEAESLAAANKRISNILQKTDEKIPSKVDTTILTENVERTLAGRINRLEKEINPMLLQRDYTGILQQLSSLKEPVDTFFDKVMVMVDDKKLRSNRLAMLNNLRNLFLKVADLSKLQH